MKSKFFQHRAIVTDTTPYETPVIFTNDKFYKLISSEYKDINLKKSVEKIISQRTGSQKIPYNYQISKGASRFTKLSIPHPIWQKDASIFISTYEETILFLCSKSDFSLRKPDFITTIYTKNTLDDQKSIKTGIANSSEETNEPSKITSYFKYGKYNLLAKFHESQEFTRLERQYKYIRQLDISKCFYNIYTHSITWAVKSKDFAKSNTSTYSFENKFDKLMQQANHNETNGIIVGPEISRIFAEIILQRIDCNCKKNISENLKLSLGEDYSIKRYVDDFTIFANSEENLNKIESVIRKELEEYKLYINEKKVFTDARPFISNISIAKIDLRLLINKIYVIITEVSKTDQPPTQSDKKFIAGILSSIRSTVKSNSIEFNSISGWLLSSIRKIINFLSRISEKISIDVYRQLWELVLPSIFDAAIHICSLDRRVRTTYGICQIFISIKKSCEKLSSASLRTLETELIRFLNEIITSHLREDKSHIDNVDIQNLLIAGAFFFKDQFVLHKNIIQILNTMIEEKNLSYFNIITVKFCAMHSNSLKNKLSDKINEILFNFLTSNEVDIQKSEHYMLICEYIGFSDAPIAKRRVVFNKFFGGDPASTILNSLAPMLGFVDWNNLSIEHLLRRKQLRPIYAIT